MLDQNYAHQTHANDGKALACHLKMLSTRFYAVCLRLWELLIDFQTKFEVLFTLVWPSTDPCLGTLTSSINVLCMRLMAHWTQNNVFNVFVASEALRNDLEDFPTSTKTVPARVTKKWKILNISVTKRVNGLNNRLQRVEHILYGFMALRRFHWTSLHAWTLLRGEALKVKFCDSPWFCLSWCRFAHSNHAQACSKHLWINLTCFAHTLMWFASILSNFRAIR